MNSYDIHLAWSVIVGRAVSSRMVGSKREQVELTFQQFPREAYTILFEGNTHEMKAGGSIDRCQLPSTSKAYRVA